ncbi:MAG: fructose-6-phosphate aldolase [Acidobacteria bacterium]|nr:fructose-6-phosphate aldolase [Acidobacteriota bacterium]
MLLFLDTAVYSEIEEAVALGVVDGVTTNPSLIAKAGLKLEEEIPRICELVQGPVSAEVLATDAEGMLAEATVLAGLHEHVVVKVPLTEAGLQTVARLRPKGVRFNVTLCFTVAQALLAAKVGAHYVSPFVGRWDDIDRDGSELIRDMTAVFQNYGFDTQILVASVRSPLHVSQAAMWGADVATLPLKVLRQMVRHPLTDVGLARFLEDARRARES